jgi:hypothetical protein
MLSFVFESIVFVANEVNICAMNIGTNQKIIDQFTAVRNERTPPSYPTNNHNFGERWHALVLQQRRIHYIHMKATGMRQVSQSDPAGGDTTIRVKPFCKVIAWVIMRITFKWVDARWQPFENGGLRIFR